MCFDLDSAIYLVGMIVTFILVFTTMLVRENVREIDDEFVFLAFFCAMGSVLWVLVLPAFLLGATCLGLAACYRNTFN